MSRPPTKVPVSELAIVFGAWLRVIRVNHDLSLQEIADMGYLAIGTLSEVERGFFYPENLSLGTIKKISKRYGIMTVAMLWRLGVIKKPADM